MNTLPANSPTRPTLLGINHDGPVRVTQYGEKNDGVIWTVQPDNFDSLIEFINNNGGPDFWKIEEL